MRLVLLGIHLDGAPQTNDEVQSRRSRTRKPIVPDCRSSRNFWVGVLLLIVIKLSISTRVGLRMSGGVKSMLPQSHLMLIRRA
jgi:hypothetical protein